MTSEAGHPSPRLRERHYLCFLSLVICIVIFLAFVVRFFPTESGHLGHDYRYFLPLLLAGKYWATQNGAFIVPAFTPAFCGGVPLLANPQSIFYSLPQLLAFVVDPVRAFLATTIVAQLLGAGGTYLLLRRRFRASTPAALLGAVLFLFNGFLLHRMMIGHVTYHVVGLIPVAAYLLLADRRDPITSIPAPVSIALTAAIVAYVVYAGAVNIVVPFGLAVLMIWLLHAIVVAPVPSFWPRGLTGGLLGIALAAMKLAPAVAFVAAFPRPDALKLMEPLVLLIGLAFGFFAPFLVPDSVRHEFEFGIGPVPLVMIVWLRLLISHRRAASFRERFSRSLKYVVPLGALLLLPVLINYDGPGFRPVLQHLPYVGSNVLLTRWWFVYIPFACVLSAAVFDRIAVAPRLRNILASAFMLVTALYAVVVDHEYYATQPYDPSEIVQADARLQHGEAVPAVSAIGDEENGLASGISRFPCYEPMFGYELQSFPGELPPGRLSDGAALRNPACYIYGEANGCAPGDAFASGSAAQAAFAAYRPFPYVAPGWQRAADATTLAAAAIIAAALLHWLGGAARRAWRGPRRAVAGDPTSSPAPVRKNS